LTKSSGGAAFLYENIIPVLGGFNTGDSSSIWQLAEIFGFNVPAAYQIHKSNEETRFHESSRTAALFMGDENRSGFGQVYSTDMSIFVSSGKSDVPADREILENVGHDFGVATIWLAASDAR
jgi:hypothetical protein